MLGGVPPYVQQQQQQTHGNMGGPSSGYPVLNPAQIAQLRELLLAQEGGGGLNGLNASNAPMNAMQHGGVGAGEPPCLSLMSAKGKTGAAALTAANLIEPRVTHVEEKLKEAIDRLSSMVCDSDAKYGYVKGTTLLETQEFVSTDADPNVAVATSEPTIVPAKTEVSLSYPQARVNINGETKIVMRRRVVDVDSAQLTFSWICVYLPDAGGPDAGLDIAYVGNFRVD